MAVSPLPIGTVVTRQSRGIKTKHFQGRILESFTTQDKLGRPWLWYQVQILNSTATARWPASHCKPSDPVPA